VENQYLISPWRFNETIFLPTGPQTPTYPDVCCDKFHPGIVCDATIDNIVGSVANIPDIGTCQKMCQVGDFVFINAILAYIYRNWHMPEDVPGSGFVLINTFLHCPKNILEICHCRNLPYNQQ
jgi:hypothetical protein